MAQVISHRLMEWVFEYTHTKALSLVTQWCLRKDGVSKEAGLYGHVTTSISQWATLVKQVTAELSE